MRSPEAKVTAARLAQPWPQPTLILWGFLSVIGAVLLLVGWARVARETVYADQVGGMTLAIAGVVVAGSGHMLMLLAGRRAVVVRRVAVLGDLRGMPVRAFGRASDDPTTSQDLVGGEGLRHYHRAGCTMAQGRNWSPASRLEHERAGRVACGVCRP